MKRYLGYLRVSTKRQGEHGVSLQEQKRLIEASAAKLQGEIVEWFEERETAAKRGRREFMRMMQALKRGKADGVILHKIDRGARNLHDWAQIAELTEQGIEVHFAHEALDMTSRGGRLAADIQAVVAADFIRNLRDEAKKGIMGRLRQGVYPFRAPLGYVNKGKGKPKEIDPIAGPLVRLAFELYATGEWNFYQLADEMYRRGIRNVHGARVSLNSLTLILNNPFYIGLMRIDTLDETFEGRHEPLITRATFDQVQQVLRGNRPTPGTLKHNFAWRRMIRCERCNRSLIGEKAKGRYVYYRCQTNGCQGTLLAETELRQKFDGLFQRLRLDEQDFSDIRRMADVLLSEHTKEAAHRGRGLDLQVRKCDERLGRLADLLLDGSIDTRTYHAKQRQFLEDKRALLDRLSTAASEQSVAEKVHNYLELANVAHLLIRSENSDERREIVSTVTSNFSTNKKDPVITLKSPYEEIVRRRISDECALSRDATRTSAREIFEIMKRAANAELGLESHQSPDVPGQVK
ncbi:MAG: recombinase family protein [Rhizomicrobium sp.]